MNRKHHQQGKRRGASSFHMQDPDVVFEKMGLKEGESFLDLGCGAGDYSFRAGEHVGNTGNVFALDCWEGLVLSVNKESANLNIGNIQAINADITKDLPIPDQSIDACLLATVLHTLHPDQVKIDLYERIKRTLKPNGRLIIINVKKEKQPFGPPLELRSSPVETEQLLSTCGYQKIDYFEFEYTYMIQFSLQV